MIRVVAVVNPTGWRGQMRSVLVRTEMMHRVDVQDRDTGQMADFYSQRKQDHTRVLVYCSLQNSSSRTFSHPAPCCGKALYPGGCRKTFLNEKA